MMCTLPTEFKPSYINPVRVWLFNLNSRQVLSLDRHLFRRLSSSELDFTSAEQVR